MLPIASSPEFHAVFAADLAALHKRVGEALATLCDRPGDESAQGDLHNALHGLKGLAGIAGSRPIEGSVTLLDRLARTAAQAQTRGNRAQAVGLFAFCRNAAHGELRTLCLAGHVGENGSTSDAHDAARRLRASARREWGDLLFGEFDLEDEIENPPASSSVAAADAGDETAAERFAEIAATHQPETCVPDATSTTTAPVCAAAAEDDVLAFLHDLGIASAPPPAEVAVETIATLPPTPVPSTVETAVEQEMLQYFIPETEEYCEGIEAALAQWEQQPQSDEPRLTLLRLYHTIKGAANSIGLSALGGLAHTLEDVFEEQHAHANGSSEVVSPDMPPLPVEAQRAVGAASVEVIRAFLRQAAAGNGTAAPACADELLARIAQLQIEARAAQEAAATTPTEPAEPTVAEAVWESAAASESDSSEKIAPVPPTQLPLPPVVVAEEPAAIFESPGARIDPATLDRLMDLVGELSVSRNRLLAKVESFAGISNELEECKSRLLKLVNDFQERHEYSVQRPAHGGGNGNNGSSSRFDPHTGVRLSGFSELEFDQYDELNILARQLVEIGADTGEIIDASRRFFLGFTEDTDRFRKASTQLQEAITQVRMVPLAPLQRRLRRVALEAAGKEGKEIVLETLGGETRLDKVLVEGVFSPLLHLVRNAVSHGIESPERREAAGKPKAGRLVLRATQRSNQAVIELEDDGGGLDFDAIRRRAVRSGRLTPEAAAEWSDQRMTNLIFQPGFSTREAAGDVAGRGIGLDAVLQQVARLGGLVEIASRAGRGCTFTLKLPLTLAIGQAMFVAAGGQKFALPLAFVDRLVPWRPETLARDADGQTLVRVPDSTEPIPFLHLDALFNLPSQPRQPEAATLAGAEHALAVVARVADKRFALSIDAVLRRAETVSKPLGPLLGEHPLFSAATIDNDGSVVLILDLPRLGQNYFARRGLHALVQAAPTASASPADAAGSGASTPAAAPAVLIVDDSLSVRKIAEKYATELGYQVETASDGLVALEKLQARRFALVLTDLEMPRMHGFELLAQIRGNEVTRALPVIVVTSRQAAKHRERADALGASDYLVKPFSKVQLGNKMADCLRASAAAAAAAAAS